jgi:hypothetical protein
VGFEEKGENEIDTKLQRVRDVECFDWTEKVLRKFCKIKQTKMRKLVT